MWVSGAQFEVVFVPICAPVCFPHPNSSSKKINAPSASVRLCWASVAV